MFGCVAWQTSVSVWRPWAVSVVHTSTSGLSSVLLLCQTFSHERSSIVSADQSISFLLFAWLIWLWACSLCGCPGALLWGAQRQHADGEREGHSWRCKEERERKRERNVWGERRRKREILKRRDREGELVLSAEGEDKRQNWTFDVGRGFLMRLS